MLTAGYQHTCGLRPDGTVLCFGAGSAVDADAPTFALTAIDAGAYQTCGITRERGIVCWGRDNERNAGAAGPSD